MVALPRLWKCCLCQVPPHQHAQRMHHHIATCVFSNKHCCATKRIPTVCMSSQCRYTIRYTTGTGSGISTLTLASKPVARAHSCPKQLWEPHRAYYQATSCPQPPFPKALDKVSHITATCCEFKQYSGWLLLLRCLRCCSERAVCYCASVFVTSEVNSALLLRTVLLPADAHTCYRQLLCAATSQGD
jgi:hypothetical protein